MAATVVVSISATQANSKRKVVAESRYAGYSHFFELNTRRIEIATRCE
jgi:hypothetical protein